MNPADTIAALASPPGPSARAVLRISGDGAVAAVGSVFTPSEVAAWDGARVPSRHEGTVRLAAAAIPAACQLWPTARSYTGQPAAELHLPGGDVLAGDLLAQLQDVGVRPATRGEFTLRAFLAGRIDLTQAEAVLGVIDAEDSDELTAALGQLAGGVSGRLASLHEELIVDLADLEAGLDFADEDLDFVSRAAFARRVNAAREEVARVLAQTEGRMTTATTETVVLSGPPNAGKSTLFNRLVGQDAAITSDSAGTTRDFLTGEWNIEGRTVRLVDTAGEDSGADPITRAAEAHRRRQAETATLVLSCGVEETDFPPSSGRHIRVQTKADLAARRHTDATAVSAVTGDGLAALEAVVSRRLAEERSGRGRLVATTAARCVGSLRDADASLSQAAALLASSAGDELVAEELRGALAAVAGVLGRVSPDDVLDRVFSRFCIGK